METFISWLFWTTVFVGMGAIAVSAPEGYWDSEKDKLKKKEKENTELINKALKHYAETNGVK